MDVFLATTVFDHRFTKMIIFFFSSFKYLFDILISRDKKRNWNVQSVINTNKWITITIFW